MDLRMGGTQMSAVSFAVVRNLVGAIALPLLEVLYACMAVSYTHLTLPTIA